MPRTYSKAENRTYVLYTIPTLLLYGLLFIFPLILGVYYSMTDWNGISQAQNFIGLENYRNLFSDKRVVNSLVFSFKYAVSLVLIVNFLAIALGLMMDSKIKFQNTFRSLYFFPAIISLVVVGLVFDQIFYHVFPRFGEFFDIEIFKTNMLGNRDTVFWAVLFVSIWRETAVPTVLILAGLQTVPVEYIEAAVLDGASYVTRLRKIIFPFLVPVLSMNLVLTVKSGIMVFDVIKAMTGGGPGMTTESIGILIYKKGFQEYQFGMASSLSFLLLAIIAVISFVQIYALKKKEVGQL
ncbi:MAG: sugar ABC transporter permease [Sphaerochaetaceae bacterium]|nr:sugar ABC transporter permease [Sphaerochaetaceae bacterium]